MVSPASVLCSQESHPVIFAAMEQLWKKYYSNTFYLNIVIGQKNRNSYVSVPLYSYDLGSISLWHIFYRRKAPK